MRGTRAHPAPIPSGRWKRLMALGVLLTAFAVTPRDSDPGRAQAPTDPLARLDILNRPKQDAYQLFRGPRYDLLC